jgi:hypothetical protein
MAQFMPQRSVAMIGLALKSGSLKPGSVNKLLDITITGEHLYCQYAMYK